MDVTREKKFPSKFSCGTDYVAPSLDPVTGVLSKDVTIDSANNVTARLYLPKSHQNPNNSHPSDDSKKLPILVYYHGGGFVIKTPFSPHYHPYLNSLVSQANLLAVSVHYRRAPKHRLPAGYDDSWAALKWVASHADGGGPEPWLTSHGDFDRIFIAGNCAGANICHQMALRVWVNGLGFGVDQIEGMVLVHPYFSGPNPIGSEERDPLKREGMERVWMNLVSSRGMGADDPWINPLAEGEPSLKGLPCQRVLVCVASNHFFGGEGEKLLSCVEEEWMGGGGGGARGVGGGGAWFSYSRSQV